ncbi:MerR family transcriptional regulator [Psychromicrobium xiongbiense]|uniref:MerR family transcriptional regulator n=1 Tax=Psychromicrobium xiongbiense TaxID=3051184 RepID=UPI0025541B80|nr:TipAS antibiotic-recognition domain-containing protein [Psychromicrobium sp. YIM S02556]
MAHISTDDADRALGHSDALGISEVARAAGVSSRTLRHYAAIGLLQPAWTASNGYRYYERPQLLRLQRILLLRELGLSLDTIAEVLAGQRDAEEALRVHRRWLLAERDRMQLLARTVESTLSALKEGGIMNTDDLFAGFEQNAYEEEAIQRWGKDAVEKANARFARMSPAERRDVAAEVAAINAGLAQCQTLGLAADDDRVQAVIARHYAWIELSWTPTAEAYRGLGQMYVDDPRFRAYYEKAGVSPEYLLNGIELYAERNLG